MKVYLVQELIHTSIGVVPLDKIEVKSSFEFAKKYVMEEVDDTDIEFLKDKIQNNWVAQIKNKFWTITEKNVNS